MAMNNPPIPEGLHVMAKPAGSRCSYDCDYCFYREKGRLLGDSGPEVMNESTLESYIRNYIGSQPTPVVEFIWHGGEPTLCGLDFFRKAVKIQKACAGGKRIVNSLQTNGSLLDDKWCGFLKENGFIVGLSLDGPEHVHNIHRRTGDQGSFNRTFETLRRLQDSGVEHNILACVTSKSARYAAETYRFFRESGVRFIQFTPVIERLPDAGELENGQTLGGRNTDNRELAPWTVTPKDYGKFLTDIFDTWIRNDVGKIFVMNFEAALAQYLGNPAPGCIHARQCGRALAVEKDGEVYACDHHVYPEFRLGNVHTESLNDMAEASILRGFGREKEEGLSRQCRDCEVLRLCGGGCPKHRFLLNEEGEPQNYMCDGYRQFFRHSLPFLNAMARLLSQGLPAAEIMDAFDGPLMYVSGDR